MLHLNTIDNTIFDLLKNFSAAEYLNNFALAGGTSLALQIGHRKSIDIDMFAFQDVNMPEVSLYLENYFEEINIRRTTPVFIFCTINKVKCDFVKHSTHKLIKPCFTENGIRFFSLEDIAAMKLNAICGRGTKKDFYDVYSLLKVFPLAEMLSFYNDKFQSDDSWMALRSLIFFEDADKSEEPELIEAFPKWADIKKTFTEEVNKFKI